MSRDRRTFLAGIGAAVSSVALAGCEAAPGAGTIPSETETPTPTETPEPTPTATQATTATATAGGGTTVDMLTEGSDYIFDPIGLFVEPGTTVTWNNASGSHSSTAYAEGNGPASVTRIPDGAEPWNSGIQTEQGATFEHTFETPGTYDYFCIPHKTLGMIGRIVVGEPGGPAEGSTPPDGDVPESSRIVEEGAVSYDEFSG
jgi:plastocyanin